MIGSVKAKSKAGPQARDQRRLELLGAARTLFAAKGYHDTTVDEITRAADVAKGTFYLYFSEKREIYHAVIEGFLELIKDVGNLVKQPTSSPVEFVENARRGARALLELLAANRQLARMAYREAMGLDDHLAQLLSRFYRDVAEVEARNIEMGMRLGVIRPCHPLFTSYVHIGMVERVILEALDHPDDFPPLEQMVDGLLRIAYEGMRGPAGPPWQAMFPDPDSAG